MEEKHRSHHVVFKCEPDPESEAEYAYSVFAEPGESLLETAQRAGVALDAPCGGRGTCGKCRVKIESGSVSTNASAPCVEASITLNEFEEGWRLACQSYPQSDVVVSVPETAGAYQSRIKVDGQFENAAFTKLREKLKPTGQDADRDIKLVKVDLDPPTADNPTADRERLLQKLEETNRVTEVTLFVLRKLPRILRESNFSVYCVLRQTRPEEFTVIDMFSAKEKPPVIAGLAIDIGTTTVSALLVSLSSGDILACGSAGNAQIRYGADVINRIIESAKPGGMERLNQALTGCLCRLIASMCKKAAVTEGQIYRAAIAANTTMTHLFLGVSPEHLRLEPYTPAFFECGSLPSGLPLHPEADMLIAPSIGSYVGGDITAGVYSSMAFNTRGISLLIDLGTNGELVLGNEEFLMSCACSAGPAFEGGDISCGMRAADGAIEACVIDENTMEPQIKVIGREGQKPQGASRPLGLCGSGLIDIVGELFRAGIINARGKFSKEGKRIRRDEWGGSAYIIAFQNETENGKEISLNETDIDNFIRAKGAIFSAIRTMLAALELDLNIIENVYVAGGIGSGINIQQAIRIGMLPKLQPEKYHYIGNSSLHGAYSMLVSRTAAETVQKTARTMTYIELSTHPGYMDEFVAACFLPHTNGGLFD
ncbi:MAG: ASKHA domain-containing protein [Treponema sp.]|jgi:uncharacterized 2Fe-2S/4Fe-4S cluster protein (DUF4445 family)|nr:ASKHA domain-containing protein [Treponema sp.]